MRQILNRKGLLFDILLVAGLLVCASSLRAAGLREDEAPAPSASTSPVSGERLLVGVGKTYLLDLPVNIQRVSLAAPEVAEAVPVSARSIMINGKSPGETSMVLWLTDGSRRVYDVGVKVAAEKIMAAESQIEREFGKDVQLVVDNKIVYLTGRVKDLFAADRARAIADTVGLVVNLLRVDVPPQEAQILLKVRFCNVDRAFSRDLGANFFGVAGGIPVTATVGSYSPTRATNVTGDTATFGLVDALNLFLYDPHLNMGTTIKALQNRNVLEVLAEPNVLAMNGHEASFVSGGEFPFPTLQGGGGGVGQITISFREFGVRIKFMPTLTPRGTIQLHVTPEVSSLDYANSATISGYTVPALSTRRVETEVELQSGQSFAIAGLLDNRTTESLSKIPGLGNIPLFGKLFQTKTVSKQNSELLIIITPELVAPIPEGKELPDLERPVQFMEGQGIMKTPPRTPGVTETGAPPARPMRSDLPVQELMLMQAGKPQGANGPSPSVTQPLNPAGGAQPFDGGSGAPGAPGSTGASTAVIKK